MKIKFDKNFVFVSLLVLTVFAGMSSIAAADSGSNDAVVNDHFVMSVPYNAGTGYHWEVSSDSYGVHAGPVKYVEDHPGLVGSSGTAYFHFHVTDHDNYYAKLVLISPAGDIVDVVDSNMLN